MLSTKLREVKPSSTLSITAKAKLMKKEGVNVIGFGAGEPDFDTPSHIKEAAIKAINKGCTKYTTASGIIELKEAICDKLKNDNGVDYKPTQIIISNGAKHSLINTFMALLNSGDEVIIPAPFWLSYSQMVKLADGVPVIVKAKKENNYKVSAKEIEGAITNKTKAIIINSPSNPTGMVYTKEELQEIAKLAIEKDIYVISDEIYEKLIYGDVKHTSIASLSDEIYKRTIIINGVSKSYSMTGWRIGYAAANEEIIGLMSNMQSHAASNPNAIAQYAALEAISGSQSCVEEMKIAFAKRREYMVERINRINGISCIPPEGAFYVFIDIHEILSKSFNGEIIETADRFAKFILDEEKVALIPCNDFGFDDHIRLSYAISLENIEDGLNRIENFLGKLQ